MLRGDVIVSLRCVMLRVMMPFINLAGSTPSSSATNVAAVFQRRPHTHSKGQRRPRPVMPIG